MHRKTAFGTVNGTEVPLIELQDGLCAVTLIPLGAAVHSLRVPDRTGALVDVCLGYDTPDEYRRHDACFGGTVGRCANRIGGARFAIGGKTYRVTANEGENCLHGGAEGFDKKLWRYACADSSVTFTLDSPDGEEGFPGALHTEVTYTLADGALCIDYRAVSDKDTVVNLTNHTYFNLSGHDSGRVDDQVLTVRAARYTPAGAGNIPTGALAPVDGTPLDLRAGAVLGGRLHLPALAGSRGFDHNYVLDDGAEPVATLYSPRTGIAMDVTTTLEGMQVYTAGFLTERQGKGGVVYDAGHAVCLETQHFPDAVNQPSFPSPVLRVGETFRAQTVYRFSVR